MHALLVAAMLTSWDVKPITPLIIEKPDGVDLGPAEPTHRREGISP